MFRKSLLASVLGFALAVSGTAADVYVRVGPPPRIIERRPPAPGRGYVWTPGYYRWDGHAHVWAPGAWVRPLRPRAHYVPAHWVHRRGGWMLIEGHWR